MALRPFCGVYEVSTFVAGSADWANHRQFKTLHNYVHRFYLQFLRFWRLFKQKI